MENSKLNMAFMTALTAKFRCNRVSGVLIIFMLLAGIILNFGYLPSALAATDCAAVTEIPQAECEALVALFESTDGPNWSDSATNKWNTDNSPSGWAGVTVTAGHVTKISREAKNLNGSVPVELGNLTNLERLFLDGNQLSGPVPPELENLTNLEWLSLYANQLSGHVPSELGNLTNLKWLSLGNNQLSGPVPSELANLTNLKQLGLYNNQLSGPVPPELRNLTNLTTLGLDDNQLSGPVPPELGNLTKLTMLTLENNQLSGSVPPELGNLTELKSLNLSGNELSGSIPPELGNLTNLYWLSLDNNELSGPVPPELGNLTDLQTLYLNGNQLSGSVPPELGNLANLFFLYLDNNELSGSVPPELGNLTNLSWLYLQGNHLSGSIPPELGNLANLELLSLSRNHLSGHVPPEMGNLAALHFLHLEDNQLSGPLPPELVNLTNLWDLSLGGNRLTASDAELLEFLPHVLSPSYCLNWQTLPPTDTAAEVLTENSARISWTSVTCGDYYIIRYGNSPGGPYTGEAATAVDFWTTGCDVTGLSPGTWYFVVETYTAASGYQQNNLTSDPSSEVSVTLPGELFAAEISNPVPGSALFSTTATFTWNDSGADKYWLWVGTTGTGSKDLYSDNQGTDTSRTVYSLPNSGETLYVRLHSLVNGEWGYNDYTYTAYTAAKAEMQTPAPGSVLTSASETFVWSDAGAGEYWLWVGTSPESNDVYSDSQGTNTSRMVAGLPGGGETLYVRLLSLVNGEWLYNDYTYTAYSIALAEMQSPVPGSSLSSTTETFIWSDAGADQYWLWIGTSPGGKDVYSDGQGTNTSRTVANLPSAGSSVYVRLYSLVNGDWLYNDYTYTAVGR
ncbi:MAG: hypothetical protein GY749_31895 [Desulfobacteraceae bacterium]|nr:hypothetical protein [Desulfobacteraceae bacterium]